MWWPQTKFGVLATVPCPRGALGEYVVGSIVAEGGAGLFSDCYSRLFHQVGWSYLISVKRWEQGGNPCGPLILLRGSGSLPVLSLSLHLFLLASGQDCGVQVRGTCLLRCAAPSHCQSFCRPSLLLLKVFADPFPAA